MLSNFYCKPLLEMRVTILISKLHLTNSLYNQFVMFVTNRVSRCGDS